MHPESSCSLPFSGSDRRSGYILAPTAILAAVLLGPTSFFFAMPLGTINAALMEITPSRMRSQAGAIMLFVSHFVGLGIGPTIIALFTDYVFHNDNLVGYSLLVVCVVCQLGSAMFFYMGIKPFLRTKGCLHE